MELDKLKEIILQGESSKIQFKEKLPHLDSLAQEMIAMSNAGGGTIIIGVEDKTAIINGLSFAEIQEYNAKIADIATNKIFPIIYITTDIVKIENKNVIIVNIERGINKPYKDKNGTIWIKQGADKRKVTDNNEILRLFQQSEKIHIDELEVANTCIKDINKIFFMEYYLRTFGEEFEDEMVNYESILKNSNILRNSRLTLAGLLFFAKEPQKYQFAFCVKAVSFFGNYLGDSEYRNSRDVMGTIPQLFEKSMDFLINNLKHTQQGQDFNSVGILEISLIALEEIVQNALIHRDYSRNSPIRILIFDNRVEIISPGKLPNSLTIENIKAGNAVIRNNLIASFAAKTLKYRGLGSGIMRAVKKQPNIEFINDIEGEQFIVKIPRML